VGAAARARAEEYPYARGPSMFSLKKRVAHSTRSSHKFSFVVHAGTASGFAAPAQGLPSGAQAVLQIARGPKVVASSPANIVMGKATWDAPLEFVCTLYSSKKIDKAFSEKTFRVSLMMLAERRRTVEIAAEEVDVAAFADQGVVEHRVSHIFSLTPLKAGKAGKAGAVLASDTLPVKVVAQVSSVYLKDLDVDPDEESISSVTPRASGLPGFVPGSTPSRAALEQDLRGFPAWDDDGVARRRERRRLRHKPGGLCGNDLGRRAHAKRPRRRAAAGFRCRGGRPQRGRGGARQRG
jgi:hypothetical protein